MKHRCWLVKNTNEGVGLKSLTEEPQPTLLSSLSSLYPIGHEYEAGKHPLDRNSFLFHTYQ